MHIQTISNSASSSPLLNLLLPPFRTPMNESVQVCEHERKYFMVILIEYVCVYTCICMYVWVCMYVCMYVRTYLCMNMYVCMYVCMTVCVYLCICGCVYVTQGLKTRHLSFFRFF